MESTNAGQQWHPYESDFKTDTPVGSAQILFVDSLVGYAEGQGGLQRTVDGGRHWVRIATPTPCQVDATYASSKWGYRLDYPAGWCDLPNYSAPDNLKYFSNENVDSPSSMTTAGIYLTLSVESGRCATFSGSMQIYQQSVLKVAGQDVTRRYGHAELDGFGTAVVILASIDHGANCYTFYFIARTRATGDTYLATADKMITSFRFT
jgi:hypothetical protein